MNKKKFSVVIDWVKRIFLILIDCFLSVKKEKFG